MKKSKNQPVRCPFAAAKTKTKNQLCETKTKTKNQQREKKRKENEQIILCSAGGKLFNNPHGCTLAHARCSM